MPTASSASSSRRAVGSLCRSRLEVIPSVMTKYIALDESRRCSPMNEAVSSKAVAVRVTPELCTTLLMSLITSAMVDRKVSDATKVSDEYSRIATLKPVEEIGNRRTILRTYPSTELKSLGATLSEPSITNTKSICSVPSHKKRKGHSQTVVVKVVVGLVVPDVLAEVDGVVEGLVVGLVLPVVLALVLPVVVPVVDADVVPVVDMLVVPVVVMVVTGVVHSHRNSVSRVSNQINSWIHTLNSWTTVRASSLGHRIDEGAGTQSVVVIGGEHA